ncbi:MAG: hypothetical protein HGA93_02110 [Methanothrix sp.]|nr:hypothetical protein [Methanothrix sp.]
MSWDELCLWLDTEQRLIHECLTAALIDLVASRLVLPSDNEVKISGKLRRFVRRHRERLDLAWTFHSEGSRFMQEDDPIPIGHPDMYFSGLTPERKQYDYDVECKLVRPRRPRKRWDYCEHYIIDGVQRYVDGRYAQSEPPLGTMLGYLQEGNEQFLFQDINSHAQGNGMNSLIYRDAFVIRGVSVLFQITARGNKRFTLTHLWVDLR